AGAGLALFVADLGTAPKAAAMLVETLAASHLAPYVKAVLGINEPNAHGGNAWPGRCIVIQEAIWQACMTYLPSVPVVSPVLKRNVGKPPGGPQYDDDLQALKDAAGSEPPWHIGDHHFYPGNAGPVLNAAETLRVRAQCFGLGDMWMTETGWTGTDT